MDETAPRPETITINGDLYELSVPDIDERIALLEAEITRLQAERGKKEQSRATADTFFKSGN